MSSFSHQYCLGAAQRLVMSVPYAWHLTNRYVVGKLN